MSRTAGWVAWSVCAVSLLVMTLGLLLIVLGWSTPLPLGWYPWTLLASDIVGALGAPILGGLIASRRPENPYGWLWLGVSISLALAMFAQVYTAYALVVAQGSLPAPRTVAVMVPLVGWVVALVLAPFLFLLFPTGRLPSRRWRSLAWSVVAVGTALVILALFLPRPTEQFVNPISMESVVGGKVRMLLFGGELLLYGTIVLSALSLVFRYRGAGRQERQQLKWFTYAAVFASLYVLVRLSLSDFLDSLLGTPVIAGLYVAIAVAILKHHLYDIDLLISRSLVYGALTVVFAGIFVIIDEVTQELLLAVPSATTTSCTGVSSTAAATSPRDGGTRSLRRRHPRVFPPTPLTQRLPRPGP